jgi:3-dehydroquinate dehydratase
VLDLDTVASFLALQLMKLEPKNIVNPPVYRRSSISLAQSTSEKALTRVEVHLSILNPVFNVYRR